APETLDCWCVDATRRADECERRAEPRLPEIVRDDGDRLAAGVGCFIGSKEAAERGLHAERRKIIAGDELTVDADRAARFAQRERRHAEGEQLGETWQA